MQQTPVIQKVPQQATAIKETNRPTRSVGSNPRSIRREIVRGRARTSTSTQVHGIVDELLYLCGSSMKMPSRELSAGVKIFKPFVNFKSRQVPAESLPPGMTYTKKRPNPQSKQWITARKTLYHQDGKNRTTEQRQKLLPARQQRTRTTQHECGKRGLLGRGLTI